jgi:hypothetical protein
MSSAYGLLGAVLRRRGRAGYFRFEATMGQLPDCRRRLIGARESVKDVPGHFVKHVMRLDTQNAKG